MKNGFVLPSCNYNIVLSDDDLKQLLDKGYVTIRPMKMEGIFKSEFGMNRETVGHSLTYGDKYTEQPVQFVTIGLDATVENYIKGEIYYE